MVLWRISIYTDLRGMGGELGKGRWHTPSDGKRIVYLAEHPALALVESLLQLKNHPEDGADQYQLLKIESPDPVSMQRIAEQSLPANWREMPAITQQIGNAWLESEATALLAIPSAPSPESTNYLLNPRHPSADQITVAWSRWLRYDHRFFRLSK